MPAQSASMNTHTSLPVLMPAISRQHWSCHSCGDCCRTLVGDLTSDECKKLDAQHWEDKIGSKPYVRIGRRAALNKRSDGACVFLNDQNRCMIHARFGEQAKPIACRIFPFSLRKIDHAWQASFRFDCPSATASKGKPISHYHSWLTELAKQVPHDSLATYRNTLKRGMWATPDELDLISNRISRWVSDAHLTVHQRLIALSRLACTLFDVKLENVRGKRLGELLDLLWQSATHEVNQPIAEPTHRQLAMLRQLAFVHAEFVTLDEFRAGMVGQLRKRWQQLTAARRFFSGKASVPTLHAIKGGATFAAVNGIQRSSASNQVDELVERYLLSRASSRSVFGAGYYGWPLAAGLASLAMSVSVMGWIARLCCAARDDMILQPEDIAQAVSIVDRAVTRLPSIGSAAERARIRYLSMDDGIVRLVHQYAMTEQMP